MAATVTVDKALQQQMTKDVIRYQLTRPLAVAMWVAVFIGVASLALLIALDPNWLSGNVWLVAMLLIAVIFFLAMTVSQVRRSVRSGMPLGTTVSANVTDGMLHVTTQLGSSDIRVDQISKARVAGSAVLLRPAGSPVWAMVPRQLLDDGELKALGVEA